MITSRGLEFCETVHNCDNCKYYKSKEGRCCMRMIDGIYGYKKTRPCDYFKHKGYHHSQNSDLVLSDEAHAVYADNKAYYIHNMVSPNLKPKKQKDDFFLMFSIKKVIFNDPATIVFWKDGEKTIVKCQDGEEFDKEKGLAMAIVKYCCGNHGFYNDIFRKWCGEDEDEEVGPFEKLIRVIKKYDGSSKEENDEHDRSE